MRASSRLTLLRRWSDARRGSPYLVVLFFALILIIFLVTLTRVKSQQILLLSKTAQDFLALTVAETGLNCVFGELSVDYDFRTHSQYKQGKDDPWGGAATRKMDPAVNDFRDLSITAGKKGTYTGNTGLGEFKVRVAKEFGKGFADTQSLAEEHMYTRVTALGHAGNSYRRIDALIEKRSIFSEHLLYDGEILDLGYGPYPGPSPYVMKRGRLYGYHYITFTTAGGGDQGVDLGEIEKIETPGMIRAFRKVSIGFAQGDSGDLSPNNDSSAPDRFKTWDGRIVDGTHSAHTHKMHRLSREYYRQLAAKGRIVSKKDFPKPSPWKNPYQPKVDYYDLDFGRFAFNDDPLNIGPLEDAVIYSEVPLRVWGAFDVTGSKTVTIFCEQDIVVGGDFNHSEQASQDYPDAKLFDYNTRPMNGAIRGDKVGAMLLSLGRIWIDHSRPSHYLKNEMRPYLLLLLARALRPSAPDENDIRRRLCPADPKKRDGLLGRGPKSSANPEGVELFRTLVFLHDKTDAPAPMVNEMISDIVQLFSPGPAGVARFPIYDDAARMALVDEIIRACREGDTGPVLTRDELDRIFEQVWMQATKEEEENPKRPSAPTLLAPFLWTEAMQKFDDGLFPPEITINAILVSSARRRAKWNIGPGQPKVRDEIGNINLPEAGMHLVTPAPAYLIQRLYGSEIRLANLEPDVFLDGRYTGDRILRRRVWDRGNQGGGYQPKGLAYTHNILTFWEGICTKEEFDAF